MMKKRKKILTSAATVSMAAMMTTMNVYALGWQHNMTGWWYGTNESNTTWHANGWQWIDGNNDGIAECYYFDQNGYMLASATTPDGFTVNADGAWTVNGAVQPKIVGMGGATPAEQNGSWVQMNGNWLWKNNDGTFRKNGWQWLDGNRDGIAECYYFDTNGFMVSNGTTPDGYLVNADGAWAINGNVQTKFITAGSGLNSGVGTTVKSNAGGGGGGGGSHSSGGGSSSGGSSSSGSGGTSSGTHTKYDRFVSGNYDSMSRAEREAVAKAIEDFKSEYDIDSLNDFEKELKIIGWLVENCKYNADLLTYEYATAYSAIIKKEAQCAGYADAFLQMAKACGLDARYVESSQHAWNLIKLDGEWYNVDVTWEDPKGAISPPYTMNHLRNEYINITDEDILRKDREKELTKKTHYIKTIKIPSEGKKYGPTSVGYYQLTGEARAVSDDEFRLYCMDHGIELGSKGGSSLHYLGYKLDSDENYFEDAKNDTDSLIRYMRSRFDQKKDAYVVVPASYDMKWFTRDWVNDALHSTGFGSELPNVNGIYGSFSNVNGYSAYRIKYSNGYKTNAELSDAEKAIRELLKSQGGAVTTKDQSSGIIEENLSEHNTSFKILYDETTKRDSKYNAASLMTSHGVNYFLETSQKLTVDGVTYRLATYTVKYATLKEWLSHVFSKYTMENPSNVFTDSFDTNVDGESIKDVYTDSINNAATSVKLPVIYKDRMDTDALKSKIIAACENAGKPVKETSYYLDTHVTKTLNGESYTAATVNIDFAVSRDDAMDSLDDKYKTTDNENVFTYTTAGDTADRVATYFESLLNETDDKEATFYYIIDSADPDVNIVNELYSTSLSNHYKLYLGGSQAIEKASYEDGALLVFKARFVKMEGTKSASAVNTVSESEDESDTTVNTEDSDGDIKDDTSKKPETEVENQEASESSEM